MDVGVISDARMESAFRSASTLAPPATLHRSLSAALGTRIQVSSLASESFASAFSVTDKIDVDVIPEDGDGICSDVPLSSEGHAASQLRIAQRHHVIIVVHSVVNSA